MQHHVFMLLFISGVSSLVSRKYHLIQQNKTWSNAQDYCRANYTDLATIETAADLLQLQNESQSQNSNSSAWIGLYNDVKSWRFSVGNTSVGWFRWMNGEPNNAGGRESCGMIYKQYWNDGWCYTPHPFVCFDDIKNGTDRYIVYSVRKTWYDAQSYCRWYHTDLATVRDSTESLIIQGKISASSSVWVWFGLFRDTWKWSDQTNMSTINWMTGQPDNKLGNEDCAYINGQVADTKCSELKPFFCYSTPKRIQIMKMKLQSDKNFNNPALKAAILEQIRQKLQEHGLSKDIMLKWKEQPVSWPEKKQILRLKILSHQNINIPKVKAALLTQIRQKLQEHGLSKDIVLKWKEQPVFHPGKKQILRLKVQSNQNLNNPTVKAALLKQIQKKLKENGLAQNTMVKWSEPRDGAVFKKIKRRYNITVKKRCKVTQI